MRNNRKLSIEQITKINQYQNRVYFITFIAYGALHLSRKCYVNVKIKLESDAEYDPTFLSLMDTMFMLFYALGSFFSGAVGSKYSAPLIVSIGLFGSAFSVLLFLISIWTRFQESEYLFLSTIFPLITWLLHGLMQSTGGPANTTIMSNWFGYKNRGYIFGTWTCHQYVGNIVAALIAGLVLSDSNIPWTFTLVIPVIVSLVWGVVCLYVLPEHPDELLTHNPTRSIYAKLYPAAAMADQSNEPSISISDALKIPNVLGYSLAFGFFKFVNYAIFFWLPFYLSQFYSPDKGNLYSILYDIGMVPGGILVGTISDMYGGRRACVIATFTLMLTPFLLVLANYGTLTSMATPGVLVLLGLIGCLIGGPINIITSAVAVDLVEYSAIRGKNDLMTVTGVINGSGSIMASLGLALIGPIQQRYGWSGIWYLITASNILGTLLLSPTIKKELFRRTSDLVTSRQSNSGKGVNDSDDGSVELTDNKVPVHRYSMLGTNKPAYRNYQSISQQENKVSEEMELESGE